MRRSGRAAWWAVLWISALPSLAAADETVEPWDDGITPHRRFTVAAQGLKQGRYVEYFRDGRTPAVQANYKADALEGAYAEYYESGRMKQRTAYRAGKRNGRFESFGPAGEPTEVSGYVDGALDGRRQVWREKKLVAAQTWSAGTPVTLDGLPIFPRSRTDVEETLRKILSGALPSAAPAARTKPPRRASGTDATPAAKPGPEVEGAPPDLLEDRENALRKLRAYRFACGIPWEGVVAGEAQTRSAQYAALVCARLGEITHTPTNPGLPAEVFRAGAAGASECNLAGPGETAGEAMDGWMDDSDPTNVEKLGHRRWSLDLGLRTTGFGVSLTADGKPVSTMHVMSAGSGPDQDHPFVIFPPRGWLPVRMFSGRHAWSVGVAPGMVSRVAAAHSRVRVRRLSADFVPAEQDLELELSKWDSEEIGGRPALIFRPKGVEVADGAAYLVEIESVDPKTRRTTPYLRWVTAFFETPPADAPAADGSGK